VLLQFEEEIARKKTVEPVSSYASVVSSVPRSEIRHSSSVVTANRAASPLVVVSKPAVTSVHVLRVLPRVVRPATVTADVNSHPSITASSFPTLFRPATSHVTSFQAAFDRAALSSAGGPSLQRLLSPSAPLPRSRLPFSSSSPNLVAGGATKHNAGPFVSTPLPPTGNGRRLDDTVLRKTSSVASRIASVSAAQLTDEICLLTHCTRVRNNTWLLHRVPDKKGPF